MTTILNIDKQQSNREAFFMRLYQQVFPSVAQYISKMGGSLDEAKDIFQDALVVFYEKTQISRVEFKQSEKAYLFGIAKHLWLKHYKEKNDKVSLNFPNVVSQNISVMSDAGYQEVSSSKLLRLLQYSGQKCMQLLSAFYYEKLDMEAIAQRFGFSGARSATVQKFKCLEKVKETVKEKTLTYEDIVD